MTTLWEQFEAMIVERFSPEDDALKQAQIDAQNNDLPPISISAIDGGVLQFLVRSINAKIIVEIGTLGGYSSIWLARALPDDGKLHTLELSEKHAKVAQQNFERAGVADKVKIHLGQASSVLESLNLQTPVDFVFIDADKTSYPIYLKWAVDNLRSGGMLVAHNAYRRGGVIQAQDADDEGLQLFLDHLVKENRLYPMILPMGDGMAVALKK